MKLRTGYLISGAITGAIVLISFVLSLPDGRLHLVFCDVGQGDAAYVRFADGRDMLVDGGPDDKVLACLGRHMPFWDRHINLVVLTHPQKDHMQGLVSVLGRYGVDYFIRSDIANTTQGFASLMDVVRQKNIRTTFVVAGDDIRVGDTSLSVLWPSESQIAKGTAPLGLSLADVLDSAAREDVLGVMVDSEMNDYSVVLHLHYGTFDAVLPGDADSHVELEYMSAGQAIDSIQVLKVPHHGSKTGMTLDYVDALKPKLAVISVGKNSYGHPAAETLKMLREIGARILRTDQVGDIEIVSDGKAWVVR